MARGAKVHGGRVRKNKKVGKEGTPQRKIIEKRSVRREDKGM